MAMSHVTSIMFALISYLQQKPEGLITEIKIFLYHSFILKLTLQYFVKSKIPTLMKCAFLNSVVCTHVHYGLFGLGHIWYDSICDDEEDKVLWSILDSCRIPLYRASKEKRQKKKGGQVCSCCWPNFYL